MQKLILIRGLPGSGKSTRARAIVAQDPEHTKWFEADHFFEKDGVYTFDGSKVTEAHKWCQGKVAEALVEGFNVVVSNTFTQKWEMRWYQQLAHQLGIKVEVETTTYPGQNIHGVPDAAVERMRTRWEE